MSRKNLFLFWLAFAVFVACALYFNRHENLFSSNRPYAAGKYVLWAAFVVFLAYSIYCSSKEDLLKSIGKITLLHWGRQIGIDLYIGLSLTLFIVYLNEGSLIIMLLWLLPTITFCNLATLLYFAIHYDSIVAKFTG